MAAPIVGTAIAGPIGGKVLGSLAGAALGESEFEAEFEFESEGEFEGEGEAEMVHEISSRPITEHEALAEMMADAAARTGRDSEAEAMTGAAVMTVLSARDRRALSALLPDLLRGASVLTRILRRHKSTRHAVRAVPTIMRRSVRTLRRQAAQGRRPTRRSAALATAREVRRVLGSRRAMATSLSRNMRTARMVKRLHQRPLRRVRG